MPDKSPHHHDHKKVDKAHAIKQRRAEKRAKGAPGDTPDPVAHIKKR